MLWTIYFDQVQRRYEQDKARCSYVMIFKLPQVMDIKKSLSNKSYTGDAGVSPAGVLEQNEVFCCDFCPL